MALERVRAEQLELDWGHQRPVPSPFASTITFSIVDVFVIWLLQLCLLKIGAFLTLRQVLDQERPVRISEMWF